MRPISFFSALVLFIFLVACSSDKKNVFPERKKITLAVYASGKIFPKNHLKMFVKYPGYVKVLKVKVGDLVKKGQVLAVLKNEQLNYLTESAKNNLNLAQENAQENSALLSALKNDFIASKSKYELDSVNSLRYARLYQENAASRLQMEQAQVQFEISKQNFQKAKNLFQSNKEKLRTEAKNAALNFQTQNENLEEYQILAEQDGKVYDVDLKLNEMVSVGKQIIEIGDKDEFEVELYIDETDVKNISMGQKILFTTDAYDEITFNGEVKEIYPRINQGNKTAKIISSIDRNENNFYSGMSVEANIVIQVKENALVIPREYLIEENKVKVKGKKELVPIKKGIEDLEKIEILEGLTEKDELEKV